MLPSILSILVFGPALSSLSAGATGHENLLECVIANTTVVRAGERAKTQSQVDQLRAELGDDGARALVDLWGGGMDPRQIVARIPAQKAAEVRDALSTLAPTASEIDMYQRPYALAEDKPVLAKDLKEAGHRVIGKPTPSGVRSKSRAASQYVANDGHLVYGETPYGRPPLNTDEFLKAFAPGGAIDKEVKELTSGRDAARLAMQNGYISRYIDALYSGPNADTLPYSLKRLQFAAKLINQNLDHTVLAQRIAMWEFMRARNPKELEQMAVAFFKDAGTKDDLRLVMRQIVAQANQGYLGGPVDILPNLVTRRNRAAESFGAAAEDFYGLQSALSTHVNDVMDLVAEKIKTHEPVAAELNALQLLIGSKSKKKIGTDDGYGADPEQTFRDRLKHLAATTWRNPVYIAMNPRADILTFLSAHPELEAPAH